MAGEESEWTGTGSFQMAQWIRFYSIGILQNNDSHIINLYLSGYFLGTCLDMINDYTCVCPTGYTGKRCEENINDCLSTPCGNGMLKSKPKKYVIKSISIVVLGSS